MFSFLDKYDEGFQWKNYNSIKNIKIFGFLSGVLRNNNRYL